MSTTTDILAANPDASLEDILRICMQPNEMPNGHFSAWVEGLQQIYNGLSIQPSLGDYAQAIYKVFTNHTLVPDADQRVTEQQLIRGLMQLQNIAKTGHAYAAGDIQPVVHALYCFIHINFMIDTEQLKSAMQPNTPPPWFDASEYINVHPRSPVLLPNMTVTLKALAVGGAAPPITFIGIPGDGTPSNPMTGPLSHLVSGLQRVNEFTLTCTANPTFRYGDTGMPYIARFTIPGSGLFFEYRAIMGAKT
ncbi:MAG: hypothetical protein WAW41_00465 [Methylobacter sp.]